MWDSKPLPVWNSLFFCLSILARNISPVLHYPPIISKFQLLSKLNLPHFSWNVLVVGTMVLEDKLLPMSLHINTSAFHMHAYTNCHVCLQPQANQNLSYFFNIPSLVNFFWTHGHSCSFSPSPPFLKCGASEHATSAEAFFPLDRPEGLLVVSHSLFFWLVNQQQ